MNPRIGPLLRKELTQLRRSRRAMITAIVMPAIFLIYLPLSQGAIFGSIKSHRQITDIVHLRPTLLVDDPASGPARICSQVFSASRGPLPGVEISVVIDGGGSATGTTDAAGTYCMSASVAPGSHPWMARVPAGALAGLEVSGIMDSNKTAQAARVLPTSMKSVSVEAGTITTGTLPGGLSRLGDARTLFREVLLPFYIVMAGALAPASFAIQTVLGERDRRSLELLMALPVTVAEILSAKIAAMLLVAGVVMVPLAVFDGVVLSATGAIDPVYTVFLVILLLVALASSIGTTLLTALATKDFRTAQNLVGLFSLPFVLLAAVTLILIPGPWNILVLVALLAGGTAGAIYVALTRFTFERYLA